MTENQIQARIAEGPLLGSQSARNRLEAEADKLLATPKAKRLHRREEAVYDGSHDVLDFIVNGGACTPQAARVRCASIIMSAGLLDPRSAARLMGCSVRSLQRFQKKCRKERS